MIKHVILWQFKDELTSTEKEKLGAEIKEGLEALLGVVPGLTDIHVYVNPLPSSNADILLDSTVTDQAALDGYAVHPAHVKVKDGLIVPNTKLRVCMDYEV